MKLKFGRKPATIARPDDHMPANGIAGPVKVYTAQGVTAHMAPALPVTAVACGWPEPASGWRTTPPARPVKECLLCQSALKAASGS